MRILPLMFKQGQFTYTRIVREGNVCLYTQCKGERINSFEVIIVQRHRAHTFPDGRQIEAGEHYPRSEQWGEAGWTFRSREAADAKMQELLAQARQKAEEVVQP